MKKIIGFIFFFTLLAIAASAQAPIRDRFYRHQLTEGYRSGQINRFEARHLQKDHFQYRMERRRAFRDGWITPFEQRRLRRMKIHEHREMFYFRHNHYRRFS